MAIPNKFFEQRVKELWLNKSFFEINGKKYYKISDGCLLPVTSAIQSKHGLDLNNLNIEKDTNNNGN